jgi:hypothetical protein
MVIIAATIVIFDIAELLSNEAKTLQLCPIDAAT